MENLLDQQFTVSDPGTVYGTDITYIATDEGWLCPPGVQAQRRKLTLAYDLQPAIRTAFIIFAAVCFLDVFASMARAALGR